MQTGTVFDIQRFCVSDGPGIRTTVFLKGCPLRCDWCHNPESWRTSPEVLFDAQNCIACGECAAACPRHTVRGGVHRFDRQGCDGCGRCAEACPTGALRRAGERMSADEVVRRVLRDRAFFASSGGGLTVSGGEPFAQPEFLAALVRAARAAELSVCLETCGHAPWRHIEAVLPEIALFLYDVKETDEDRHRAFTGASMSPVMENLRRLSDAGARIVLRCPVIPGRNDRPGHFEALAGLAESLPGVERVDVEPYHPLGVRKSAQLGLEARYAEIAIPDAAEVDAWIERIRRHTRKPVRRA